MASPTSDIQKDNLEKKAFEPIAYSVNDFCKRAGICRTRFYEEVKLGRIQIRKSGKRTLIPASELNNWLDRLPGRSVN